MRKYMSFHLLSATIPGSPGLNAFLFDWSSRSFNGELKPNRLGDGHQSRKPRVAAGPEGAVQALVLDPGGLGDSGQAVLD